MRGPEIPPIVLDRAAAVSLGVQLAAALREAAATGTLRAGDRLPSTRALAATLGISRTVTAAAYEQLLAEGWVAGRRGSGTYITAAPPSAPPGRTTRTPSSAGPDGLIDLRAGSPCVEVLDRSAWRRAWRAGADLAPDSAPRPDGDPAFRAAVVEHLLRHRGLPADPADVLATAGSTAAIGELARTLPRGAAVAVEEPGYRRAAAALAAAGLVVVPVRVDGHGLDVEALPVGLAAVYCTPAHQFPLGGRLPATRRVALVERARTEGFLVIEDDYDGELRYDVAPLPLLAALGPDVVVHLGTASKLLTPTLSAGWLVAPPAVRAAVLEHRDRAGSRPSPAGQRVFAALAAHGDLARHLRRLRHELADRRVRAVTALTDAGREPRGDAAGAHLVVPLPHPGAEEAALAAAAARGVVLDGLIRHYGGSAPRAGLVLGYAGPARADLEQALTVVADVLRR
ncbi:MocR-like pyridoxine biosynthesis transcription factor PdxR [Pseudonocardia asaccharolytica]|uniref:GntR family transcriptional regulator n=1 Tax=Pseudonocardia asaccharolytica DSM 44247 = NBRC 16224 TaxID=1123024 RepID=A0A511D3K0_9PSEU|nr:PLP-dependent aminotransferase family protein [Pseudonocardia asaccharolytica]GEL19247.1 GntR family transcriptional regulator [Pseudonocardia asaccharolytica DSM 44247 = NBRC 16224]